MIFQFIWEGRLELSKFHLSSWGSLSKLKDKGAWGIKNLFWFNQDLYAKSLWHSLFNDGLWGGVLKDMYLNRLSMVH